jgi:hypothetical protein
VGIVAIAASHSPFKNLVMRRHGELMFDLAVTTEAELRLAHLQQFHYRKAGFFRIRF